MAIPDFQTIMRPLLELASTGEVGVRDAVEAMARKFALTDEERQTLLPSGKQTRIVNRTTWAKSYLLRAGLLVPVRRGVFTISQRGREVLGSGPARLTIRYLEQFPEFEGFRDRRKDGSEVPTGSPAAEVEAEESETPEDRMRLAHSAVEAALAKELLARVIAGTPAFFERVVVDLLLAMGYGGSSPDRGRVLGKPSDDGVDGVVDQDPLGLDRVYVQAKRYAVDRSVGSAAVREFAGSLGIQRATKGLFVTTSTFSSAARETAAQLGQRIVLVDGEALTRLMIAHNVGCRIEETLHLRRVDEEFFDELS